MTDHQQRSVVALQRRDELGHAVEIEIVGRFVEDQQLRRRLGQQQRGQAGPEALAAGQRGHRPGDGVGVEPEAGQLGAQGLVVGLRRVRGDARPARSRSSGSTCSRCGSTRTGTLADDRSRLRRDPTGDRVDQRGLARAVRTDQADPLRSAQMQLDPAAVTEFGVHDQHVAAGRHARWPADRSGSDRRRGSAPRPRPPAPGPGPGRRPARPAASPPTSRLRRGSS